MALNELNTEQNSSNIRSIHSSSSRLSPQVPRQQSYPVRKFDGDSSSRRIRNRYKSAFTEIGLDEAADTTQGDLRCTSSTRPGSRVRWGSQVEIHEAEQQEEAHIQPDIPHAVAVPTWHRYGSSAAVLSRLSFLAVVLAIMIPVLHMSPFLAAGPASLGAEAGPITPRSAGHEDVEIAKLESRQNNPAGACLRWSQQSAVVNGTMYLYGGREKTDSNQDSKTWSE
jgi:hypothetical protein